MRNRDFDPIAFELFKNSAFAIADEMALTICRVAYSPILRDTMDYSTALTDAAGTVVAQGLTLPGHLGSVPEAVKSVLRDFDGDLHEGDVVVMNDPFDGGMHLPDIFAFKPIFHAGTRIAFAATTCHQADIGGRVPGSMAADSNEIFQEGLRIPPLKLYEKGERNESLFQMIEKNVRMPVTLFGDLRAQLSACHIAERQFLELIGRFGAEPAKRYMRELVDHAERMTRAAISELPDGTWSFEDWIDDDGVDLETPVRLFLTITKSGDGIMADWTGSSAQVKAAINSTHSFSAAATYTAVRSILPADIPTTRACSGRFDVTTPPGTVTSVVMPGACAMRGVTGFRMMDCTFGALAMMVPDKVGAASDGGVCVVAIGGRREERAVPYVFHDACCGAWAGGPGPTGSRPTPASSPTSPRNRSRWWRRNIPCASRPTSCCPTGPAPGATGAAIPTTGNITSWRRRGSCRFAPTVRSSALTACMVAARPAVVQPPDPRGHDARTAGQGHGRTPPRRPLSPRMAGRRRLGRPADARCERRATRCPQRIAEPGKGVRRLWRRRRPRGRRYRRGGNDRATPVHCRGAR